MIVVFPKVIYDKEEYKRLNYEDDNDLYDCIDSNHAMASSIGVIWLSKPSIKWLIHELLHIIGWKFTMPIIWHKMIHIIL